MGLFSRRTVALAAAQREESSFSHPAVALLPGPSAPVRDDPPPGPDDLTEHWPELMRHARRLMGNPSDAQDLVQDTFERAVRGLDRFQPGTNLRAWLYTIMVRRATDQFRSAKVRTADSLDAERVAAPGPVLDEIEESPWMRVTDEQFRCAVHALPEKYRQIFDMHEVHQLAYQDIAARLDIPVNTVATRLYRARQKLNVLLSKALEKEGRA